MGSLRKNWIPFFVKLRDSKTENGLINYTKDKNNEETDLKMEIVKEIFQVKKMEADAQQIDIAKEKRREELIEAIKAKDSENLRHMTREELENELKALESM